MNILERALLYLKRKKIKSMLLFLTLTVITSGLLIGMVVWKGSRDEMKELQMTYGNSFKVTAIIPKTAEDKRLWEETGDQPGYPQYRYKGSKVDDELIRRIREVEGLTAYCKEYTLLSTYLPEIDLIDGLHTYMEKEEEKNGGPLDDLGLTTPWLNKKIVGLQGCTDSTLLPYFRSNTLELIEGDPIRKGDKYQILISDQVAKDNQLEVGDQIRAARLYYPALDKMSREDKRKEEKLPITVESCFTIAGIFHVNIGQYINEWTVEEDIANNFMFIDIDSLAEMYKADGAKYGEALDPLYTASFFVDDPARLDEIITAVKGIPGINWSDYDIRVETSLFESALQPLESMNSLVTFLIVFLLAVCLLFLILVLRIWIGARKKEIGILISLGETKGRILGQMFLEGGILLFASLILAAGITAWSAERIGNGLLDQMNYREEKASQTDLIEEPTSMEEVEIMNEQFQLKNEVDPVEKLPCRLEVSEIMVGGVLLYAILGLVVWLESGKIFRTSLNELTR